MTVVVLADDREGKLLPIHSLSLSRFLPVLVRQRQYIADCRTVWIQIILKQSVPNKQAEAAAAALLRLLTE